jgi:hypothetical protein
VRQKYNLAEFIGGELKTLKSKNDEKIISYVQLRQLIGILGILLPVTCLIGGLILGHYGIQTTLSGYYYTNMQDVFVGILVGVGMFLVTYKGYEFKDQLITTISGIAALGVAIFPCNMVGEPLVKVGVFELASKYSNIVHSVSALSFFLLLAINSIWIFTLSDHPERITINKKKRNRIYRFCGWSIIGGIVLLFVAVLFFPKNLVNNTPFIFTLESLMLLAFGISWLVKGETILKDDKDERVSTSK